MNLAAKFKENKKRRIKRDEGGRVHMADGGTPVTDPDVLSQLNAPAPVTDPALLAQLNSPASSAATPSISDRMQNMWDKATPGGPLWMIKQAVTGAKGAVEGSAAATSTTTAASPDSCARASRGAESSTGSSAIRPMSTRASGRVRVVIG